MVRKARAQKLREAIRFGSVASARKLAICRARARARLSSSKRGSTRARRRRSKVASAFSTSVVAEIDTPSAPAEKPRDEARLSSSAAKAVASRSPAPSLRRLAIREVAPALSAGSSAAPPRKLASSVTTGIVWSS
jgi:hypothetical protein